MSNQVTSTLHRSRSLGRDSEPRHPYAFGSSTPRELSYLNLPRHLRYANSRLGEALHSSPVRRICRKPGSSPGLPHSPRRTATPEPRRSPHHTRRPNKESVKGGDARQRLSDRKPHLVAEGAKQPKPADSHRGIAERSDLNGENLKEELPHSAHDTNQEVSPAQLTPASEVGTESTGSGLVDDDKAPSISSSKGRSNGDDFHGLQTKLKNEELPLAPRPSLQYTDGDPQSYPALDSAAVFARFETTLSYRKELPSLKEDGDTTSSELQSPDSRDGQNGDVCSTSPEIVVQNTAEEHDAESLAQGCLEGRGPDTPAESHSLIGPDDLVADIPSQLESTSSGAKEPSTDPFLADPADTIEAKLSTERSDTLHETDTVRSEVDGHHLTHPSAPRLPDDLQFGEAHPLPLEASQHMFIVESPRNIPEPTRLSYWDHHEPASQEVITQALPVVEGQKGQTTSSDLDASPHR